MRPFTALRSATLGAGRTAPIGDAGDRSEWSAWLREADGTALVLARAAPPAVCFLMRPESLLSDPLALDSAARSESPSQPIAVAARSSEPPGARSRKPCRDCVGRHASFDTVSALPARSGRWGYSKRRRRRLGRAATFATECIE
jgi:hypothetical protein